MLSNIYDLGDYYLYIHDLRVINFEKTTLPLTLNFGEFLDPIDEIILL